MSGATQPWSPELDAVIAAPKHHRLLFENDRVRILDTRGTPAVAAGNVLWSGPLGPHTLENVGPTELHVVSTELKDPAAKDNL